MSRAYGRSLVRLCLVTGASLLIATLLLLSNLEAVAFDLSHYQDQFRRLERPAATGMTEEELLRVTREIIAYLKGQRQDLDLVAEINNRELPLFTRRERQHMVDVRNLFARGFQVRNGGLFLLGVLAVLGMIVDKGGRPLDNLIYIVNRAGLAALLSIVAMGLVFSLGFDYWFDVFHFLSFDNDLWLLDPARHNLIKMFPQAFFFNTTRKFVGRSLLQLVVLVGISGWYLRHKKGKVRDGLRAGPGRIP